MNFTKDDHTILWQELTSIQNSIGIGARKTPEKWQKCWSDLKYNVRNKAAKVQQYQKGTGGGPQSQENLTELEHRVLAIIGRRSAVGDESMTEGGFNTLKVPENNNELRVLQEIDVNVDINSAGTSAQSESLPEIVSDEPGTSTPQQLPTSENVWNSSSINTSFLTPIQPRGPKRKRSVIEDDLINSAKGKLSEQTAAIERQTAAVERNTAAIAAVSTNTANALNNLAAAINRICETFTVVPVVPQ